MNTSDARRESGSFDAISADEFVSAHTRAARFGIVGCSHLRERPNP